MKNYVFIYYNEGTREGTSAETAKAEYMAWFGKLGDKLVDGGNPFNSGGKAVEKNGVSTIENHPASGYSIVKASSLDEAVDLAKGCPILEEPAGAVRVYETLPM
jgi:hypothetical protein